VVVGHHHPPLVVDFLPKVLVGLVLVPKPGGFRVDSEALLDVGADPGVAPLGEMPRVEGLVAGEVPEGLLIIIIFVFCFFFCCGFIYLFLKR